MRRIIRTSLISALVIALQLTSVAIADHTRSCSRLAEPTRSAHLQALPSKLKIGTWNTLNLFDYIGDYSPEVPGQERTLERSPKHPSLVRQMADIIFKNNLDIVALQEVEGLKEALEFCNHPKLLDHQYYPVFFESNDNRKLHVAFFVKKSLPLVIETRSFIDETWVNPNKENGKNIEPVFARNLGTIVVRNKNAPPQAPPLLVMMTVHLKSKRSTPGDPEGILKRAAEVQRTAEIIRKIRKEFGENVPLILAGDFNNEVKTSQEFEVLRSNIGLIDSFDALKNPPKPEERVTHSYLPRFRPKHYSQLDAIFVSSSLASRVLHSSVYRYRGENGQIKPLPTTRHERNMNPSDHFPIFMDLDIAP